jgi:FkbM family methyltransferase
VLISVQVLKKYWGVNPKSIVHVGAHNAEELEAYALAGWGPVTWIEAQPQKIHNLLQRVPLSHTVIEAAVWDVNDVELNLNIMTNTESTSLLKLGTHATEHPTVTLSHTIEVKTKTLKTLLKDSTPPELLALDIQGVELRAIKGYESRISEVKWIYCEVNKDELYEGCCLITDLDSYLLKYGFKRSVTRWTLHNWGDALYENENLVQTSIRAPRIRRVALYLAWAIRLELSRIKNLLRKMIK